MNIQSIFARVVVLFFAIILGYVANRCGYMDGKTNRDLSAVVLNITNPALIISSVIGTERVLTNVELFVLTGLAFGSYLFLILIALVLPRLLRVPPEKLGIYQFMTIFANVGFMGLPVVAAIFGPNAVFYAALFNIPFNLLLFTYGIPLVQSSGGKLGRFRMKQFLTPTILACIVAYFLYLLDWNAPDILVQTSDFVGQITSPAAMLIIGSALAMLPLRQVFCDRRIYAFSLLRLLAVPLLLFAILRPFLHNDLLLGVVVVETAMPVGTNAVMMTAQYGGDNETAAKGIFISTLLSIGTIPFLMWLLFVR